VSVLKSAAKPSALLRLPSGKQVQLKAGQTFDATGGKIREGYQGSEAGSQETENR